MLPVTGRPPHRGCCSEYLRGVVLHVVYVQHFLQLLFDVTPNIQRPVMPTSCDWTVLMDCKPVRRSQGLIVECVLTILTVLCGALLVFLPRSLISITVPSINPTQVSSAGHLLLIGAACFIACSAKKSSSRSAIRRCSHPRSNYRKPFYSILLICEGFIWKSSTIYVHLHGEANRRSTISVLSSAGFWYLFFDVLVFYRGHATA